MVDGWVDYLVYCLVGWLVDGWAARWEQTTAVYLDGNWVAPMGNWRAGYWVYCWVGRWELPMAGNWAGHWD